MKHMKKTNTFVIIIMTIIDVFLIGGYLQDAMKGNISMNLGIIVAAATAATLVADYVVYFIKKDGNLFRFVSIIGYAVIYGIALINAKSDTVFTMAFPIMVMYVLYFDTLFMGIISGVFLVLNIVSVVMAAISGSMPSGIDFALSSALLQAATIGVTGSALTWITHLEKAMKGEQMNEVKRNPNRFFLTYLHWATRLRRTPIKRMLLWKNLTMQRQPRLRHLRRLPTAITIMPRI